MVNLVNRDRANTGLQKLTVNEKLTKIARMKAKDMADKGYLGYTSPTYGRTTEMLNSAGVKYITMSENIVAAYSIEPAHRTLMEYSRQRSNILNPDFQEVGVGVVKSGRYGYIIVEIFLETKEQANPQPVPQPELNPVLDEGNNSGELDEQAQKEYEMLEYVNEARRKAGVAPLKMDNKLVQIARLKSQDMVIKNYFDHTSPTYGSPFEMMSKFGVDYHYAGENLAGHYSVSGAHNALMNSPGHRRNILDPNFTHIGIGIVEGGPYGMMFTQMFVGY